MLDIGKRIKARRKELKLSAEYVAAMVGISAATMYRYEKNEIANMGTDKLQPIAYALSTSPAYLMGWTDDPSPYSNPGALAADLPSNVRPITDAHMHSVPLIGEIAAGQPILAEHCYDTFVPGPMGADFALTVCGDSMEPTYLSGDIVYLRQQDDVDDGQVAAVIIDDEATLKHVVHIPNGLTLISDNPKHPPRVVTLPEHDCIRILGLVIGYTRMYN